MNLESTLKQSIDTIQKLSESNARLTYMTEDTFNTAFASIEKCEQLMKHCAKIYNYLNMKHSKTWEEKESLDILFDLITRNSSTKERLNKEA